MHTITVKNLRGGYLDVIDYVLSNGKAVSPRGVKTLEITPATIVVLDPSDVVPLGVNRKPNLAIGAAESCHLVGGISDAEQMVKVTKNFAVFVEEGRLRGAYGPRTREQFPRVADLLKADPDSRQAGAVIWKPDELATPSKDVPCTVLLHFKIRDGKLNMYATMRSNDVFWGLCYDAWMFANVQRTLAWALEIPVGTYYHTALSLHAYVDRDRDKFEALGSEHAQIDRVPMIADDLPPPRGFSAGSAWRLAALWARAACLKGEYDPRKGDLPASVAWYAEKLKPYLTDGDLCTECGYVTPAEQRPCVGCGRA